MVDANVLISGSVWPRFPYAVLRHALAYDFQLVLCPFIIQEAHKRMSKTFPDDLWRFTEILGFSEYEEVSNPTKEELAAHAGLVRDSKDIPVALAAINAQVDCFITQDKDLTGPNEPIHQYLTVLLPGTFLRDHMGWTSDQLEAIRKRNWGDLKD